MNRKYLTINLLTLAVILTPISTLAEDIKITVKGMVCSFCAQGIEKTFKKKPEVSAVKVDLDKFLVEIETAKDTKLSDETITSTITDAGYDVVKIERS
jgi:copper chaperone CopZ